MPHNFMRNVLTGIDEPIGVIKNPEPQRFHMGSFMPPDFAHLESPRRFPVFNHQQEQPGTPTHSGPRSGRGKSF